MEPDPQREHGLEAERQWSPYDEMAANEEAEYRRGRRRRWLLGLGAIALVMLVVLGVAGYVLYDRASRTDRSTPVVVVFQYVNAVFDERDLDHARLFECDSGDPGKPLQELLTSLEELERRFDILVTVSATDFRSDIRGSSAIVGASLLIDVPEADGEPSRSRERWVFDLQDDDGWRICGTRRE
ncbi:hypothetical protein GCM10009557_30830 [Virgisporangium ochraceum]|uniref:Uncharacterized protein n=1 Tax=Virgisporangium ochraceum TaxID=65505 RepID=A0A8J4EHE8_9ACTN|nr:hypothetical protein [Virgisporangium ochraceum]GIJ74653.1 hypothetical protein Voc01_095700 [Virgisporangium ochraceum]